MKLASYASSDSNNYTIVAKAINTYILVKLISSGNNVPWMTPQLKRLIRKKQRIYNKAKRSKQSTDWVEHRGIQAQVHQSICADHQNILLILQVA